MVCSYVFDVLNFNVKEWYSILSMVKNVPPYEVVVGENSIVLKACRDLMGGPFVEIPHNKIIITDYGILQEFFLSVQKTRNQYYEIVKGYLCSDKNKKLDFKLFGDDLGKGFFIEMISEDGVIVSNEFLPFNVA